MKPFPRRMLTCFVRVDALFSLIIFAIGTFLFFRYRPPTLFWLLGAFFTLNTAGCWIVLDSVYAKGIRQVQKWYRRKKLRSLLGIMTFALLFLLQGLGGASFRLFVSLDVQAHMAHVPPFSFLFSFVLGTVFLCMEEISLLVLYHELKKTPSENTGPEV